MAKSANSASFLVAGRALVGTKRQAEAAGLLCQVCLALIVSFLTKREAKVKQIFFLFQTLFLEKLVSFCSE